MIIAYLDPGTGSYIFQIIAASVVGGLYFIKRYYQYILACFRRLFMKTKKDVKSERNY